MPRKYASPFDPELLDIILSIDPNASAKEVPTPSERYEVIIPTIDNIDLEATYCWYKDPHKKYVQHQALVAKQEKEQRAQEVQRMATTVLPLDSYPTCPPAQDPSMATEAAYEPQTVEPPYPKDQPLEDTMDPEEPTEQKEEPEEPEITSPQHPTDLPEVSLHPKDQPLEDSIASEKYTKQKEEPDAIEITCRSAPPHLPEAEAGSSPRPPSELQELLALSRNQAEEMHVFRAQLLEIKQQLREQAEEMRAFRPDLLAIKQQQEQVSSACVPPINPHDSLASAEDYHRYAMADAQVVTRFSKPHNKLVLLPEAPATSNPKRREAYRPKLPPDPQD